MWFQVYALIMCLRVPIHFHSVCCLSQSFALLIFFSLFSRFETKKKKFLRRTRQLFRSFSSSILGYTIDCRISFFGSDRCRYDKSFGKLMTIIRKRKEEQTAVRNQDCILGVDVEPYSIAAFGVLSNHLNDIQRSPIFQVYRLCLCVFGVLSQIELSSPRFVVRARFPRSWIAVRNCDLSWDIFDTISIWGRSSTILKQWKGYSLNTITISELSSIRTFYYCEIILSISHPSIGAIRHAFNVFIYTPFRVNIEQYPMQYWPRYLFINAHTCAGSVSIQYKKLYPSLSFRRHCCKQIITNTSSDLF